MTPANDILGWVILGIVCAILTGFIAFALATWMGWLDSYYLS